MTSVTHWALHLELWLVHHFPGRQSHKRNEVYQRQRLCYHKVGCSLHCSWHWGWSMSYVGLTSTSWIAIEPLFLLWQSVCFIDIVQCPSPAAWGKSLSCRTIVSRWWMITWAGFICPGTFWKAKPECRSETMHKISSEISTILIITCA